ncbi:MAG: hypothetical protein II670_14865 [Alphaproteobacteria bacterium]|nr:hypothetical protein [Alphaproteobacteria bacterium]
MKRFLARLGHFLVLLSCLISNMGTVGLIGEVEPPKIRKPDSDSNR